MKKPAVILFFLAVAGITFIALFLRVWSARTLADQSDERTYLRTASLYAQDIQQKNWSDLSIIANNTEHPSFVKLLYGVFLAGQKNIQIKTGGLPILKILLEGKVNYRLRIARNVSLVFGVLAVAVLAVFNPIAGLFLAVHSFAIKYTSEAYLDAVPALTSLLAALTYLRWITLVDRQPKPLALNHSLRIHFWLVLSGLAIGITLASKYEYGLIGIAIVVHYAIKTIREGYPWRKAILFLAGYGLVAAFFSLQVIFICGITL